MAGRLIIRGKGRIAQKGTAKKSLQEFVVVGNYKERQLAWIEKNGVYNYPVRDGDEYSEEGMRAVKELWLFANVKSQRHAFAVRGYVGKMTKDEFLAKYPTYAKLGKMHHAAYYVFKVVKMDYEPNVDNAIVIARTADFGKRSAKIKKAIEQFKRDGEFAPLAVYLPKPIAAVPPKQLRVCEAAVQLNFLTIMFPPQTTEKVSHIDIERHGESCMTVIDLFAGCGGMSLGFELAGFKSVLAVEKDAWASETYAYNRPGVNVVTSDITKILHPKEQYCSIGDVFGIIGGPPCQGFSLSGDRDPKDPRNSLFMDYMRFVKEFCPHFFVMENVPGILSSVTKLGEPVRDVVVSVAQGLGYNVKVMELDAADYGVPQSRHRVFFVGIRNDYPFDPDRLAPKMISHDNPITIRQALSDLPVIQACEGSETMVYATPPSNDYQRWCRKGSMVVENHIAMRHTKRLVARFHVISCGQSAADVPEEHMQRKRGNAAIISGKVYSQNNMRPFPDKPSPTVPASFQSNFVHPLYDRNYTAREGARLQSFPDSYIFRGRRTTMSWEKNLSQYQQIGNAVPPLLAKALGEMIKNYFRQI